MIDLPPPKVSISRAGVKSAHTEQMVLLEKMDSRRIKENPKHNKDFCTHEHKHCGMLITMGWKVNGSLASIGSGGTGSYHVANASRHLESHCNEASLHSIESLLNEKGQTNETLR